MVPELFVPWDSKIRANSMNELRWKKIDERTQTFAEDDGGYYKFLIAVQAEVKEALEDGRSSLTDSLNEVYHRLDRGRPELDPERLGPSYVAKPLAKLVDEYNWAVTR